MTKQYITLVVAFEYESASSPLVSAEDFLKDKAEIVGVKNVQLADSAFGHALSSLNELSDGIDKLDVWDELNFVMGN